MGGAQGCIRDRAARVYGLGKQSGTLQRGADCQADKEGDEVDMLPMLKSSPRCNGDLFVDWDQHGWYLACIQCGYVRDLATSPNWLIPSANPMRLRTVSQ